MAEIKTKQNTASREVDWFHLGFSPRKTNLSLHLVLDLKKYDAALKKLGKFKSGVGCLYISKLSDVDLKVLKGLIAAAAKK